MISSPLYVAYDVILLMLLLLPFFRLVWDGALLFVCLIIISGSLSFELLSVRTVLLQQLCTQLTTNGRIRIWNLIRLYSIDGKIIEVYYLKGLIMDHNFIVMVLYRVTNE